MNAPPHAARARPDEAGSPPRSGFGAGPAWRERILDLRDRVLASRRFRSLAAAFPPTRPLARRRARELFDLCAGFVYSQVLAACVQLRVFDLLADGAMDVDELAARMGLAPEPARRLLDAAQALRLVTRRPGGRYGLGPLGAPLAGNAGLTAMIEHHALLYADLRDPVALLSGRTQDTALSDYWAYARDPAAGALASDRVAAYSRLMADSQPMIAEEVLAAYDFGRHRCLLDVGGGHGAFLAAAGAHHPQLGLMLFDLPAVADSARERLAAAGLAGRATAIGGDFRRRPLPRGADVISLVRVAHDHDDATVRHLFGAVRAALPPGGTLILAEPMAGTKGALAMGDAYFGFYLLAMGGGRPRTRDALAGMLRDAGFDKVHPAPTRIPLQTSVLVAQR